MKKMNETKIVQCLIICCMMMSGAALLLDIPSTELSDAEAEKRESHGSHWTTSGEIEVVILTDMPLYGAITWNPTTQVYDLPHMSELLRVQVNATGLEPDRNFVIDWQLYGYVDGNDSFGPLRHMDPVDPGNDLLSGRYGPITTTAGTTDYNTGVLRGYSNGMPMNNPPTNLTGCYWVMATLSVQSGDPDLPHNIEIMQSNVSKRVSYGPGNQCPTDDQDGDGWTDAQEAEFGSDANSSSSTPYVVWQSGLESTYADGYSDGQTSVLIDTDGDGVIDLWDNCTDTPSGSYVNSVGCPIELTDPIDSDEDGVIDEWDDCPNTGPGTHVNSVGCPSDDSDDDGCGTCCADNATCQDDLIAANDKLIDTDQDGVIDIWEDEGCTNTSSGSYVNSTGCADNSTSNQTSNPGLIDPPKCDWDKQKWDGEMCVGTIEITGSGDAADLTLIGGAGLLVGIGVSSILGQTGRGPNTSGSGNKKPNIDLDDVGDVFDNLDLDLDADLDLDKPDVEKAEPRSRSGSDQYFKSGVERQKAMTDSGDPLLDDYVEDEVEGESN